MKLLSKTNLYYVVFSSVLLIIAGSILYIMLTSIIEEEVTEKLIINKDRVVRLIENGERVTSIPPVLEITELNTLDKENFYVRDTVMYDSIEEETELFREVSSFTKLNGANYRITLRQIILEPHDYYNSIGYALGVISIFLLGGILIINRMISKSIWKPFYQNLELLKSYSLSDESPISLYKSTILEFKELNQTIEMLSEKARSDFRSLKEFSENASHEIQTPLAIIQTKMEELLQSPDLTKEQSEKISAAYSTAMRLKKLNKSLLLITKIENRQFEGQQNINLSESLEKTLSELEEMIAAKNISLSKDLDAKITVKADPILLDSMVVNLLSNAIKHNIDNGHLSIVTSGNTLKISNSGLPLSVPANTLFERFSKANPASRSLGLGLSIIKKICDSYGWNIQYSSTKSLHEISIQF